MLSVLFRLVEHALKMHSAEVGTCCRQKLLIILITKLSLRPKSSPAGGWGVYGRSPTTRRRKRGVRPLGRLTPSNIHGEAYGAPSCLSSNVATLMNPYPLPPFLFFIRSTVHISLHRRSPFNIYFCCHGSRAAIVSSYRAREKDSFTIAIAVSSVSMRTRGQ